MFQVSSSVSHSSFAPRLLNSFLIISFCSSCFRAVMLIFGPMMCWWLYSVETLAMSCVQILCVHWSHQLCTAVLTLEVNSHRFAVSHKTCLSLLQTLLVFVSRSSNNLGFLSVRNPLTFRSPWLPTRQQGFSSMAPSLAFDWPPINLSFKAVSLTATCNTVYCAW